MNAKEYLSQAYKAERAIKSKMEQITKLESLSTEATQIFGSSGGLHDNSHGSKIENMVVSIVELKDQLAQQVADLVSLRKSISQIIHAVNNLEYEHILEERYLNYKSWNDMCDGMSVSLSYLYHIHGKALQCIHVPE